MPIKIGLPSSGGQVFDLKKPFLKTPSWWVKTFQFEYWNWLAFYGPIIPSWIWLGMKAHSITFFTAVNPLCSSGGFLKENKWEVLKYLPKKYLPHTLNLERSSVLPKNFNFPCIAKPNSGQRGTGIVKLENYQQLEAYHKTVQESYILQEFISDHEEYAIFYSRLSTEKKGIISSVTKKEFMSVLGDGISSIRELMVANERYEQQVERLSLQNTKNLDRIPKAGEHVLLEPIGNHCRGTKFINMNKIITDELALHFDEMLKDVDGFYYGRFDLKVPSEKALLKGSGIKVMELNGVNADPAHIFDPNYTLLRAYKDIFWHWSRMATIAKLNIKNGVRPLPVKTVWHTIVEKFI